MSEAILVRLGSLWAYWEAILATLGTIVGLLGAILGPSGSHFGTSCGHLEATPFSILFGLGHLAASWGKSGPSRAHLI